MREPGPDHPITVAPHPGRVRVRLAGIVVAESADALVLREATYPPVFYIPRADVRLDLARPSERTSTCPYKGLAGYHGFEVGGAVRPDIAWSYEDPFPAVRAIAGHLAFYPDRVDSIEAE